MSLSKRDAVWHYDFWFRKQRYQGSTYLRNHEKAKAFERKLRTDLAMGLVGLVVRPQVLFRDFMHVADPEVHDDKDGAFITHVRQNIEKPRTIEFYIEKATRLLEYPFFKTCTVDQITLLKIQEFKAWRQVQKKRAAGEGFVSISAVNGELRTLRKALIMAFDFKLMTERVRVSTLPGEKERMYVLTGEVENAYLAKAEYPLKQAATLILDLGLRPDECVCLERTHIFHDEVIVWDARDDGKSDDAWRAIPQTDRTREVFKFLMELWPDSRWIFPGDIDGTHLTRGALDHMHARIRDAKDSGFSKEFVLYSCRHTFGTRLAESTNGDIFAIKELMGHSSVEVSQKYVHPSSRHTRRAMKQKELLDRTIRGENAQAPTPEVPTILATEPEAIN